jgi:hypothetical protein
VRTLRTFQEARAFMESRFGPLSAADKALTEAWDQRIRRLEAEHAQHHAEIGIETCWACEWPLSDSTKVVTVKLANGAGEALTCGTLCASKVRDLAGATE